MSSPVAGFPPKVFLIGAQKAGTTSLAHFLDLHPGIRVAQPKEPHYFTRFRDRDLDWYRSCFGNAEDQVLIDASTSYTMAPMVTDAGDRNPAAGVPDRIHAISPDARFIYLLRDPVERTYSAYWHQVRIGQETRPFRDAISGSSLYLDTSNYAWQINLYLEYFARDRFLFLLSDSLAREPSATLETCFRFLGVPQVEVDPEDLRGRKNRSYQYRGLGRLLPRLAGSNQAFEKLARKAKAVLPRPLHPLMKSLLTTEIPPLSEADRAYLRDYFRPMKAEVEGLTGLCLDGWQI